MPLHILHHVILYKLCEGIIMLPYIHFIIKF